MQELQKRVKLSACSRQRSHDAARTRFDGGDKWSGVVGQEVAAVDVLSKKRVTVRNAHAVKNITLTALKLKRVQPGPGCRSDAVSHTADGGRGMGSDRGT